MVKSLNLVSAVFVTTSLIAIGCTSTAPKAEVATPAAAIDTPAQAAPVAAPEAAAAPAVAPVTQDSLASALANVYFEYDSSTLSEQARTQLDLIANALKTDKNTKLVVEGHTDSRGSEEYNLALSSRRAESIAEYLTTSGVSSSQLVTEPKGELFPVANGQDESAYSQNRRGEFKKF